MCDSARLPRAESRYSDDPCSLNDHQARVTDIPMRGLKGNDGRPSRGHRSGAGTIGRPVKKSCSLANPGEISLRGRRLPAASKEITRPQEVFHVRYSPGTSIAFQSDLFA
jgi:hypothetical protein